MMIGITQVVSVTPKCPTCAFIILVISIVIATINQLFGRVLPPFPFVCSNKYSNNFSIVFLLLNYPLQEDLDAPKGHVDILQGVMVNNLANE